VKRSIHSTRRRIQLQSDEFGDIGHELARADSCAGGRRAPKTRQVDRGASGPLSSGALNEPSVTVPTSVQRLCASGRHAAGLRRHVLATGRHVQAVDRTGERRHARHGGPGRCPGRHVGTALGRGVLPVQSGRRQARQGGCRCGRRARGLRQGDERLRVDAQQPGHAGQADRTAAHLRHLCRRTRRDVQAVPGWQGRRGQRRARQARHTRRQRADQGLLRAGRAATRRHRRAQRRQQPGPGTRAHRRAGGGHRRRAGGHRRCAVGGAAHDAPAGRRPGRGDRHRAPDRRWRPEFERARGRGRAQRAGGHGRNAGSAAQAGAAGRSQQRLDRHRLGADRQRQCRSQPPHRRAGRPCAAAR